MKTYPDSIRSNPSAYLMYAQDDPRSVHLLALESVFLSFANTRRGGSGRGRGTAKQLRITVNANGSLTVFDDGVGLAVDSDSVEVCFTDIKKCEEQRRTSLALLNALCEELTYETAQDGGRWRYHSCRGKSVNGLQRLADCSEQWQTVSILPDPDIFAHQVTVSGFSDMLQAGLNGDSPFEEPYRYAVEEVPVVIVDASTGQERQLSTVG